jgi:hypothetical protein
MSLVLKFGPWIALAIMTALYLGKRDDLAQSIEQCNTDKMTSIAEAERITREAVQRAADERIEQATTMAANAANARDAATQKSQSANMDALRANQRVRELELEASIDEIPDSSECLIVFLPSGVLHPEDCGEAGIGGSGSGEVCAGAEGINRDNPAFATITFGDSVKLWNQDRAGLVACNARLSAIRELK